MAEKDRKAKRKRNERVEQEAEEKQARQDTASGDQKDDLGDYGSDFVLVDTDRSEVMPNPLDEAASQDSIAIGTDADAVMKEIDDYTDDADILEDFAERQGMMGAGSSRLLDKFSEMNEIRTPETSADDIDADWERDFQSGEESVGGTVPTPDQDVVEELGEATGIEYADGEPLDTETRLDERDRERWELNPESTDDLEDAEEEEEEASIEDLVEETDVYESDELEALGERLIDEDPNADLDEEEEDELITEMAAEDILDEDEDLDEEDLAEDEDEDDYDEDYDEDEEDYDDYDEDDLEDLFEDDEDDY